MLTTQDMEMDAALDGQLAWMRCIITSYTRKYQTFAGFDEDFFGDFVIHYLQNRHKYDPARASRSHWIYWLFRSWAWRRRKSDRKLPKCVQKEADPVRIGVELEADERQVVDCFCDNPRLTTVQGLAERVGASSREVEGRLSSIRHKVSNRRSKVIVRN